MTAATLRGSDRAAELLRQAIDTIETLPFSEPATLDRLAAFRTARDAAVLALRAIDEAERPAMLELDNARRQWLAEQVAASLPETAEIPVTVEPSAMLECVGCGELFTGSLLETRAAYATHKCSMVRAETWSASLALFDPPGPYSHGANRR